MRKAKPKKRVILPDPVFNDKKVSKFVNHLMYDGKKSVSYEIFYNALETVKGKMQNEEKSALEIWKQALDNITPQVEVKSRRIGGATFQVPTEIRPDRKESISMKNMISFARKRSGKSMADKLAAEIMDAYNNQGGAFKRKEDMHRMAEANRAFALSCSTQVRRTRLVRCTMVLLPWTGWPRSRSVVSLLLQLLPLVTGSGTARSTRST